MANRSMEIATRNMNKAMEAAPTFDAVMNNAFTQPTVIEQPNETATELLRQLNEDWTGAVRTGGTFDRFSNFYPTSSWDWENRTDIAIVGKPIPEGLKDTGAVMNHAHLNWGVELCERSDKYGVTPDEFSIRRTDNHALIGKAGARYHVIDNYQMFGLTSELINLGFNYRNAGCFDGGKVVYVSLKADNLTICGEPFHNYIVVANSFDMSKSFGLYVTPVRIWCKNTFAMATKKARYTIRHTKTAAERIETAKASLRATNEYMVAFKGKMEQLAMKPITEAQAWDLIKRVFPIKKGEENKVASLARTLKDRNELMYRYLNAPDHEHIKGTAYGLLSGAVDMRDHTIPGRQTANWQDNRFKKALNESSIIDTTYTIVNAI